VAERRLKERTQQVKRANVLAAAAALFGQKGYENTTMADVARLADVAVGTLYKLFPSKEAMKYALLEWRAEAVLSHAPQGEGAREVPNPSAGSSTSFGVRQSGAEALLEEDQLGIWLDKEPERRQRDLQAKRAGILRAALRVFEEKGFFGATMADIAAEAGIATGTLYNFFASKDELFHTLLEQKASEFFAYLHEQVDPIPLAVDKIARMVAALVDFFEENREFLRLYATARSGFEWAARQELGESFRRQYTAYLAWIAGILAEGMAQGTLRPVDPAELAQALVGMLNATLFEWTIADGNAPLAGRAEFIIQLFLYGAHA
jgi:AcrR family transcriptional regulator